MVDMMLVGVGFFCSLSFAWWNKKRMLLGLGWFLTDDHFYDFSITRNSYKRNLSRLDLNLNHFLLLYIIKHNKHIGSGRRNCRQN